MELSLSESDIRRSTYWSRRNGIHIDAAWTKLRCPGLREQRQSRLRCPIESQSRHPHMSGHGRIVDNFSSSSLGHLRTGSAGEVIKRLYPHIVQSTERRPP